MASKIALVTTATDFVGPLELAPFGIPVNAIAPNYLYSEACFPKATFIDNPVGREFIRTVVPAGRLGEPEEIGELVTYLANMKGAFHTGTIMKFAGGWPAAPERPIWHLSQIWKKAILVLIPNAQLTVPDIKTLRGLTGQSISAIKSAAAEQSPIGKYAFFGNDRKKRRRTAGVAFCLAVLMILHPAPAIAVGSYAGYYTAFAAVVVLLLLPAGLIALFPRTRRRRYLGAALFWAIAAIVYFWFAGAGKTELFIAASLPYLLLLTYFLKEKGIKKR
jgi:hypothetical protein